MEKVDYIKENNSKSKKSNNKIFIFVLIAFSVYFIYTILDQQIQINKYNSQIDMYNAEILDRKEQTVYYKNQSKNINSDEYIEQVARDTLGYVKPYEKVFVDTNK